MHNLLALLCVSLMAAHQGTSFATEEDEIRNIIYDMTNIALVHIRNLQLSVPEIEVPTPSFEGLTNISYDLGLLDNELQYAFTEVLTQIQADVSSLEGRVRFLASSMGCSLQAKPAVRTGDGRFPESHVHMTVTKVQHYLENLIRNKGKLSVC